MSRKDDQGKVRPSLLPVGPLRAVTEVLEMGANKYSVDGWKEVPDAERRYLDALYRHLWAFQSGEEFDPESGLSHLAHLACNSLFLIYFEELRREKEQDTN